MRSFSFVDAITELEAGRRARGRFVVPAAAERFPPALLVEAVGQLAGWVAMEATDFTRRPVAALAHRIVLGRSLDAGTRIDLAVEIERADRDAVLYDGTATVGGAEVTRLHRCLGPMLPLADFDAPDAVRTHFAALRSGTVEPHAGDSTWRLQLFAEDVGDEHAAAVLHVPTEAAFLAEHFPRKPVLPATLLFDAQIRLAIRLARDTMALAPDAVLIARVLREAKVRAFMSPGTEVVLGAHVLSARDAVEIALNAKVDGRQVASARVEIEVEHSA